MINTFNFAMLLLIAAVVLYAVLSPHIKDGVIIKVGLICISFGSLTLAAAQLTEPGEVNATHALALINAGLLIALAGYVLRRRRTGPQRRMSDWADTQTYDPPTSPLGTHK